MIERRRVFSAVLLWAACASGVHAEEHTNTVILRATMASLNLQNPEEDAERKVARGDWRLIGLNGFTCTPPEPEGLPLEALAHRIGLRCLEGTSDMWEGQEHRQLIEVVRRYGITYNRRIHDLYCAKYDCGR